MLTKEILGTPILVMIEQFIVYSMIGWLVESIYMSICNKKLTNRGFGIGPFCPIYGFGAVIGNMLLSPFYHYPVVMYFVGAISATTFEFLVGKVMQYVFREVWWDYHEKPFNYQGIICLESTIAWGFYGMIIVYRLNGMTLRMVEMIPMQIGKVVSMVILFLYLLDFTYHALDSLDYNLRQSLKEKKDVMVERYRDFLS